MRLTILTLLTLATISCLAKDEDESNELSLSSKPKNLDANLRRALLKALTELEEDDDNGKFELNDDRLVEKASASAVSIFSSSESASKPPSTTTTTATPATSEETKPIIVVQKSQGIQHAPITTVEKEHLDPFNDAEQILTSASSSFTIPSQEPSTKSDVEARSSKVGNTNLIESDRKATTKLNKVTTTTAAPLSSTEENEAKVEDVQFFSAPLVAAFTVHQDEQGIPKKVEQIYKPVLTKKQEDDIKLTQQAKLREEKIALEQKKRHQEVAAQIEQQQKQKALEEEIARLNLSLKQQQQVNQQQQDYFLRQQHEQLRLRNNAQPFRPMVNPTFIQRGNFENVNTEKPVLNQFVTNPPATSQQFPKQVGNGNSDNRNSVSLLPSITYDPLVEAGKLPLNAQILPVKGAVNFHTPIIQVGFQQFQSLPHVRPNAPFATFNQLPNVQSQFGLEENQRNRFFRQEAGTGNFLNNDVSKKYPSFSIQKSVQPPQQNSFSENNLIPNLNAFALPHLQQNRFFRSNVETQNFQQPQNNRFFRSNLESSLRAPNNYYQQSQLNNYQLRNLLQSSGAFKEQFPVDINIISKVLSYNHSGDSQFVSSRRRDQFV